MIRVEIFGAAARCVQPVLLTAGMVGLEVAFGFSAQWEALQKWAVFTDGAVTRDVLLEGAVCTVPHEVLAVAGRSLRIGVYGVGADGAVVIPTVYAQAGVIRPGAEPSGDESYPPSADAAAQLAGRIAALEAGQLHPVEKTEAMTRPVGVDSEGRLFTAPEQADVEALVQAALAARLYDGAVAVS